MDADKLKHDFLRGEIWLLTIGGAFQRANVYKQGATETAKDEFKKELFNTVTGISEKYTETVSVELHLKHIEKIASIENESLNNGQLNIGVSQKVLNLYLKYLWCLGEIPAPPHFPVDRIIQQKLKCKRIISWTGIKEMREYEEIIAHAREKLKEDKYKKCSGLAELELYLFNRRAQDNQ
jgi:hypothetical protein